MFIFLGYYYAYFLGTARNLMPGLSEEVVTTVLFSMYNNVSALIDYISFMVLFSYFFCFFSKGHGVEERKQ